MDPYSSKISRILRAQFLTTRTRDKFLQTLSKFMRLLRICFSQLCAATKIHTSSVHLAEFAGLPLSIVERQDSKEAVKLADVVHSSEELLLGRCKLKMNQIHRNYFRSKCYIWARMRSRNIHHLFEASLAT